eukprot:7262783-Prymnesium_polylepis.1
MARPAAGRHHGAHVIPHPRARAHAISVRVASSMANAPRRSRWCSLARTDSARTAHKARPRNPLAPAHMMHMSLEKG